MINTVNRIVAEDVEISDELDFDGDEYADNEYAIYGYATVLNRRDWYYQNEPWVTLVTDQGSFDMPAGHLVRVKVND